MDTRTHVNVNTALLTLSLSYAPPSLKAKCCSVTKIDVKLSRGHY